MRRGVLELPAIATTDILATQGYAAHAPSEKSFLQMTCRKLEFSIICMKLCNAVNVYSFPSVKGCKLRLSPVIAQYLTPFPSLYKASITTCWNLSLFGNPAIVKSCDGMVETTGISRFINHWYSFFKSTFPYGTSAVHICVLRSQVPCRQHILHCRKEGSTAFNVLLFLPILGGRPGSLRAADSPAPTLRNLLIGFRPLFLNNMFSGATTVPMSICGSDSGGSKVVSNV